MAQDTKISELAEKAVLFPRKPMKTLQDRDHIARARTIHRRLLETELPAETRQQKQIRGIWAPSPDLPLRDLAAAIEQLERNPATAHLKSTPRSSVLHGELLGHDAIVKRYSATDTASRLKSLFRASAGRRAWIASRTFSELELPTPQALGCMELGGGRIPETSYFITRFVGNAEPARNWIKPHYHRQPEDIQRSFRKALLEHILNLYRHGVCHGDLKSLNILVANPTQESLRAFYWIDLDSTQFGVAPTRHHITRNLIQLNGSLGSKVSDEDRLAFLEDMSATYPWVTHPRVVARIRKRTRRRLERELNRICGP